MDISELPKDIIYYLSKFIWRYDYTLLDKGCRDYYLRQNGINITDFHKNYYKLEKLKGLEKSEILEKYAILRKYDVIAKPKIHFYKCLDFIEEVNATNSVKKLRTSSNTNVDNALTYCKFPNVEHIWGPVGFHEFKRPDFFPGISKKNITVWITNIDDYDIEIVKKIEGHIHSNISKSLTDTVDIGYLDLYHPDDVPVNLETLRFEKLVKLFCHGYFPKITAPNLKKIGFWDDIGSLARIIREHPKIEKIVSIERINDIYGEAFVEDYELLHKYDFIREIRADLFSYPKDVEYLIDLEKKCISNTIFRRKTRIIIPYLRIDDCLFEQVIALFDVTINIITDSYLFDQIIARIEKFRKADELILIKILMTDSYGLRGFCSKILKIFREKNILINPFDYFDNDCTEKVLEVLRLEEKYFG